MQDLRYLTLDSVPPRSARRSEFKYLSPYHFDADFVRQQEAYRLMQPLEDAPRMDLLVGIQDCNGNYRAERGDSAYIRARRREGLPLYFTRGAYHAPMASGNLEMCRLLHEIGVPLPLRNLRAKAFRHPAVVRWLSETVPLEQWLPALPCGWLREAEAAKATETVRMIERWASEEIERTRADLIAQGLRSEAEDYGMFGRYPRWVAPWLPRDKYMAKCDLEKHVALVAEVKAWCDGGEQGVNAAVRALSAEARAKYRAAFASGYHAEGLVEAACSSWRCFRALHSHGLFDEAKRESVESPCAFPLRVWRWAAKSAQEEDVEMLARCLALPSDTTEECLEMLCTEAAHADRAPMTLWLAKKFGVLPREGSVQFYSVSADVAIRLSRVASRGWDVWQSLDSLFCALLKHGATHDDICEVLGLWKSQWERNPQKALRTLVRPSTCGSLLTDDGFALLLRLHDDPDLCWALNGCEACTVSPYRDSGGVLASLAGLLASRPGFVRTAMQSLADRGCAGVSSEASAEAACVYLLGEGRVADYDALRALLPGKELGQKERVCYTAHRLFDLLHKGEYATVEQMLVRGLIEVSPDSRDFALSRGHYHYDYRAVYAWVVLNMPHMVCFQDFCQMYKEDCLEPVVWLWEAFPHPRPTFLRSVARWVDDERFDESMAGQWLRDNALAEYREAQKAHMLGRIADCAKYGTEPQELVDHRYQTEAKKRKGTSYCEDDDAATAPNALAD
ncbi:Hypothetical protein UVM_LOCUS282 [uncultured virus]|nr:Hypothetical protein UVM_LOCUS282 [uncultured virus]